MIFIWFCWIWYFVSKISIVSNWAMKPRSDSGPQDDPITQSRAYLRGKIQTAPWEHWWSQPILPSTTRSTWLDPTARSALGQLRAEVAPYTYLEPITTSSSLVPSTFSLSLPPLWLPIADLSFRVSKYYHPSWALGHDFLESILPTIQVGLLEFK